MRPVDPLSEIELMNEADTPNAVLAEFNDKFMVVNENGKAVVYAPRLDRILRRQVHDRIAFSDLRALYLNRIVALGSDKNGKPVTAPAADWWLRSPSRRQFIHGVAFDPTGREQAGVLNLWQGFAVEPRPGSWELLKQHVRIVICSGVEAHFRYLIGWLARMVQRPAEQGEVAVVMRSGQGTGKGTLCRAIKRLLGQHALAIANAKHLTGNFNAHLRDCIFLFADEAFFAGDKQHVGVLNSLITEDMITIEGKYQNAVDIPNYLHVMMASNEEWVIPASLDARRFFCLEVSHAHQNDHAYFAAIWIQLEIGGYEAMLLDLLHYDLTGFNVRRVPETAALQEQKKLSLPIPESWWLDVLHRGYVWRSKLGLEAEFGDWHEVVSTELLFASYSEYGTARRDRHPMTREAFGKFMLAMKAKPTRRRGLIVGEHMEDHPAGGRQANVVRRAGLTHAYSLGAIDLARSGFIAETNLPVHWQEACE